MINRGLYPDINSLSYDDKQLLLNPNYKPYHDTSFDPPTDDPYQQKGLELADNILQNKNGIDDDLKKNYDNYQKTLDTLQKSYGILDYYKDYWNYKGPVFSRPNHDKVMNSLHHVNDAINYLKANNPKDQIDRSIPTPKGITTQSVSDLADDILDDVQGNNTHDFFNKCIANPTAIAKAYWMLTKWKPMVTQIIYIKNPDGTIKSISRQEAAITKLKPYITGEAMDELNKLTNGSYSKEEVEDFFTPLNSSLTTNYKSGSGMKRKYKRKLKK
jgi:hypothetical protein